MGEKREKERENRIGGGSRETELGKGRSLRERARQPETTEASILQKLWPRLKVDLPISKDPD